MSLRLDGSSDEIISTNSSKETTSSGLRCRVSLRRSSASAPVRYWINQCPVHEIGLGLGQILEINQCPQHVHDTLMIDRVTHDYINSEETYLFVHVTVPGVLVEHVVEEIEIQGWPRPT